MILLILTDCAIKVIYLGCLINANNKKVFFFLKLEYNNSFNYNGLCMWTYNDDFI